MALAPLLAVILATASPASLNGATVLAASDLPEREPGHVNVRRRMPQEDPIETYWEGFTLMTQGDCDGAVAKLAPLARRGRGYEDAQHHLGLCLMHLGGLPFEGQGLPGRDALLANERYRGGLLWVERAANAGSFQAQGTLIRLYAAGIGPDTDPAEAAKWLSLYEANPMRLALGAPHARPKAAGHLKATLPREAMLEGETRARNWIPRFWEPSAQPVQHAVR